MDKIYNLVAKIKLAKRYYRSTALINVKINLIMNLGIQDDIEDIGLEFSYERDDGVCDKNTLKCYMGAVEYFRSSLGNLVDDD